MQLELTDNALKMLGKLLFYRLSNDFDQKVVAKADLSMFTDSEQEQILLGIEGALKEKTDHLYGEKLSFQFLEGLYRAGVNVEESQMETVFKNADRHTGNLNIKPLDAKHLLWVNKVAANQESDNDKDYTLSMFPQADKPVKERIQRGELLRERPVQIKSAHSRFHSKFNANYLDSIIKDELLKIQEKIGGPLIDSKENREEEHAFRKFQELIELEESVSTEVDIKEFFTRVYPEKAEQLFKDYALSRALNFPSWKSTELLAAIEMPLEEKIKYAERLLTRGVGDRYIEDSLDVAVQFFGTITQDPKEIRKFQIRAADQAVIFEDLTLARKLYEKYGIIENEADFNKQLLRVADLLFENSSAYGALRKSLKIYTTVYSAENLPLDVLKKFLSKKEYLHSSETKEYLMPAVISLLDKGELDIIGEAEIKSFGFYLLQYTSLQDAQKIFSYIDYEITKEDLFDAGKKRFHSIYEEEKLRTLDYFRTAISQGHRKLSLDEFFENMHPDRNYLFSCFQDLLQFSEFIDFSNDSYGFKNPQDADIEPKTYSQLAAYYIVNGHTISKGSHLEQVQFYDIKDAGKLADLFGLNKKKIVRQLIQKKYDSDFKEMVEELEQSEYIKDGIAIIMNNFIANPRGNVYDMEELIKNRFKEILNEKEIKRYADKAFRRAIGILQGNDTFKGNGDHSKWDINLKTKHLCGVAYELAKIAPKELEAQISELSQKLFNHENDSGFGFYKLAWDFTELLPQIPEFAKDAMEKEFNRLAVSNTTAAMQEAQKRGYFSKAMAAELGRRELRAGRVKAANEYFQMRFNWKEEYANTVEKKEDNFLYSSYGKPRLTKHIPDSEILDTLFYLSQKEDAAHRISRLETELLYYGFYTSLFANGKRVGFTTDKLEMEQKIIELLQKPFDEVDWSEIKDIQDTRRDIHIPFIIERVFGPVLPIETLEPGYLTKLQEIMPEYFKTPDMRKKLEEIALKEGYARDHALKILGRNTSSEVAYDVLEDEITRRESLCVTDNIKDLYHIVMNDSELLRAKIAAGEDDILAVSAMLVVSPQSPVVAGILERNSKALSSAVNRYFESREQSIRGNEEQIVKSLTEFSSYLQDGRMKSFLQNNFPPREESSNQGPQGPIIYRAAV